MEGRSTWHRGMRVSNVGSTDAVERLGEIAGIANDTTG